MNFKIVSGYIINKYFIEHPNEYIDSKDLEMSKFFNISYVEYEKLLIKYGAISIDNEYYFETEAEAQKFLNSEELMSYLILARLNE